VLRITNPAMFNIAEDICSMTEFKRRTANVVHRLRDTGRAVILKPTAKPYVVQDAASYQRLLDRIHASENGRLTSTNGD